MRPRRQYRLLQAAFVFALVGVAFFGSYLGGRYSDYRASHPVADHGGKKHPPPFTSEWFIDDPVAFATFILACVTGGLFVATVWIVLDSREASTKALDASEKALVASTKATETLVSIECACLTGGGDIVVGGAGGRYFRVNVANYGKTPAYLFAFDVQFDTLQNVMAGPKNVAPTRHFDDRIAPGTQK